MRLGILKLTKFVSIVIHQITFRFLLSKQTSKDIVITGNSLQIFHAKLNLFCNSSGCAIMVLQKLLRILSQLKQKNLRLFSSEDSSLVLVFATCYLIFKSECPEASIYWSFLSFAFLKSQKLLFHLYSDFCLYKSRHSRNGNKCFTCLLSFFLGSMMLHNYDTS